MGIYAITGGASGIGAAIKNRLQTESHEVIVIDIVNGDIEADLSSQGGREHANSELAKAASAGLDGFIACAGVGNHITPFSLITRVNYFGALASIEGARDLVAKKKGAMVIVSSQSAVYDYDKNYLQVLDQGKEDEACAAADALDGMTAYGGAKYALARWMRQHCVEYAALGVRVNAIAPGYTETPLNAATGASPEYADAVAQFKAAIPVGFTGTPEDQAAATCFLLSPEARYICGAVLFVDGGSDAMFRPANF
jgi:NAD(P)-dependent dehydrogenase (short-subunit alcohol dehydrogenase family)